jgi:cupin 2 domain-containing protein
MIENIFKDIKEFSEDEVFNTLYQNSLVKIERIISYGQSSAVDYWYEQSDDEYVFIVEGEAEVIYDSKESFYLKKGDSLYIEASQKHRVTFTKNRTIWLAIFIKRG